MTGATHSHGQSHGHSHGIADIEKNGRILGLVALLIGSFMIAEFVGGLLSGSLALLADAGHMLSDFASLTLAWYAFRLSRRRPTARMTYGVDRMQILVAFGNTMLMVFLCVWIVSEAIQRIISPGAILGEMMLVIATIGLVVNVLALAIISRANRDNLNVRGARLHVMGDLLGSLSAIAAAGIIMATGWTMADPILSLVIVAIILRNAWPVMKDSAHILLEGSPDHLSRQDIRDDLTRCIDDVVDIHHVHFWSITQARTMATLHARVRESAAPHEVIGRIKERLHDGFGIEHVTVEIEHEQCSDGARP
ncbi:MAG: cation transporter [Alphaproteobacteria bacterium]|nr:cation transporter [Alphaproteobacteria bacterium]